MSGFLGLIWCGALENIDPLLTNDLVAGLSGEFSIRLDYFSLEI